MTGVAKLQGKLRGREVPAVALLLKPSGYPRLQIGLLPIFASVGIGVAGIMPDFVTI